jgi:hypothetical protein
MAASDPLHAGIEIVPMPKFVRRTLGGLQLYLRSNPSVRCSPNASVARTYRRSNGPAVSRCSSGHMRRDPDAEPSSDRSVRGMEAEVRDVMFDSLRFVILVENAGAVPRRIHVVEGPSQALRARRDARGPGGWTVGRLLAHASRSGASGPRTSGHLSQVRRRVKLARCRSRFEASCDTRRYRSRRPARGT